MPQSRRQQVPPRPNLPTDEEPQLPRGVIKEIERAVGRGKRAREIALALSIGSAAIDEDRVDIALAMLAWAKHQVPRVASVREAYGVALYLAEDFGTCVTELQAYRRMTGRNDQNHLIADAQRAIGRDLDLIADLARDLVEDDAAPLDRRVEAAIVWAAATADSGDVTGARAILRRFLANTTVRDAEMGCRIHYLAGDLAERANDGAAAREAFDLVKSLDADYMDIDERIARL